MKKVEDYLKDCQLKVWEGQYSVFKTNAKPDAEFVCYIKDHNEITIVAETGSIASHYILEEESGWKIITFEAVLPFDLVGFMAAVAKVLAEEQISIFALSAYSTDHVLVKVDKLESAIQKLKDLGCVLKIN